MAFTKLTMKNPLTGFMKQAPVGFSWTTLIFGPFPAFLRGDVGSGILIAVLYLFTGGIAVIPFAFLYNKMYLKKLMFEGYKVAGADEATLAMIRAKTSLHLTSVES